VFNKHTKLLTRSGYLLDIQNPRFDQYSMGDIAYGLSRQFRYGGALGDYTVAQHSVLVAKCVFDNWPGGRGLQNALKYAMLHDASEAFIRDIPSPAKHLLPDYIKMETRLMDVILGEEVVGRPSIVKEADYNVCVAEANFFAGGRIDIDELFPPPEHIMKVDTEALHHLWGMDESVKEFMGRWHTIDWPETDEEVTW